MTFPMHRPHRHTSRLSALLLSAGLLAGGLVVTGPPAAADDDVPPGRRIVHHTVRPGETATELAVRYHAWTAELISINHLGPDGTLVVGDRLRIPVVKSAKKATRHADPKRDKVRRIIVATAKKHGVDPHLALAVSWQESGWAMHHVSSAHAIGAMQVLPDTGQWMSLYAGRRLKLHDVHDNALAGVLLLDLLGDLTDKRRHQVGAYYQGLGAVREHGLYDETRAYVRNVMAIKRRLEATGRPV